MAENDFTEEIKQSCPTLEKQLLFFEAFLDSKEHSTEKIKEAKLWLKSFPGAIPERIQEKINNILEVKQGFEKIIPQDGWFNVYNQYTQYAEAPSVFQFFCGATILGTVIKKNLYFIRGHQVLYPNLGTILIAPTGVCRKTKGATDIAINLLRKSNLARILPERMSPEFFLSTLSKLDDTPVLAYAPELKFMFGENKYLKDMMPVVTRLLDRPETLTVGTIVRGLEDLKCTGLSVLGGCTPDIMPDGAFSGGFFSRFLFIVQWTTNRRFANPPKPDPILESLLLDGMLHISKMKGEVEFTKDAATWYADWYENPKEEDNVNDEHLAGYYARKHTFLVELAMIIMASHYEKEVTVQELEESLAMLEWIESFLPSMFKRMLLTQKGRTLNRIMEQIRRADGSISHSDLLRKNSYDLNTRQVKEIVNTAIEAKLIKQYKAPNGIMWYDLL